MTSPQSYYDDTFLATVPKGLTLDELVEWLDGGGFVERSRVDLHGFVSIVFSCAGDCAPSWPSALGVIIGPSGAVVLNPHYNSDILPTVHGYDAGCDCSDCVEARDEDAALKAAGL